MDLLPSIVESYSYANMYNEFGGGNADKIMAGGIPVNRMFAGNGDVAYSAAEAYPAAEACKMSGGGGPLANRYIPVGLGLISVQPFRSIKFAEQDAYQRDQEVIPEHIFDYLFGAVSRPKKNKNAVTKKNHK